MKKPGTGPHWDTSTQLTPEGHCSPSVVELIPNEGYFFFLSLTISEEIVQGCDTDTSKTLRD